VPSIAWLPHPPFAPFAKEGGNESERGKQIKTPGLTRPSEQLLSFRAYFVCHFERTLVLSFRAQRGISLTTTLVAPPLFRAFCEIGWALKPRPARATPLSFRAHPRPVIPSAARNLLFQLERERRSLSASNAQLTPLNSFFPKWNQNLVKRQNQLISRYPTENVQKIKFETMSVYPHPICYSEYRESNFYSRKARLRSRLFYFPPNK
jgi:hypothetical protein